MTDAASDETAAPRGELFCAYTLGAVLGRGGMATVYNGHRNDALRIPRAIKVLHPELRSNPDIRARFDREANMSLAVLEHPAIISVLDAGECEGAPFIVFEFVDGIDLSRWLATRKRPLPLALALHVLRVVFGAVEYAHHHDVIHRDLKPANIMLSRNGQVKLGDFGVARSTKADHELTQVGQRIGTIFYMSPEQFRREPLEGEAGKTSDIFSLGTVSYQLLVGERPFEGESVEEVGSAIVSRTPDRFRIRIPGLPLGLAESFDSMLDKDPCKRPRELGPVIIQLEQALAAFHRPEQALERYLEEPNVVERELGGFRLGLTPAPDPFGGRVVLKATIAAMTLVLVAVLAFVGYRWFPHHETRPTPPLTVTPAPTASLTVASTPPGAAIQVAGKSVGVTPITLDTLAVARTSIRLEMVGFKPFVDTVDLVSGHNSKEYQLTKLPVAPTRKFHVQTKPAYAAVYVDGSNAPLDAFATVGLGEGVHTFRLRNTELHVDKKINYTVHATDPRGTGWLILDYDEGTATLRIE